MDRFAVQCIQQRETTVSMKRNSLDPLTFVRKTVAEDPVQANAEVLSPFNQEIALELFSRALAPWVKSRLYAQWFWCHKGLFLQRNKTHSNSCASSKSLLSFFYPECPPLPCPFKLYHFTRLSCSLKGWIIQWSSSQTWGHKRSPWGSF